MIESSRHARWLWFLLGLFILRVVGQMLVAFAGVTWLPPMDEWYSEALSYPWLLASQFVIIILFAWVAADLTRSRRFFAMPRLGLGNFLFGFGLIYLAVMIIRYIVRMSLYPPERWTGGSIPIFFHWVLASYVLVWAHYHRSATRQSRAERWRLLSQRNRRWRWVFRAVGVVVLVVILLGWTGYLLVPSLAGSWLGIRPAQYAVRIERSVGFTTADGIRLVADLFHPRRAGATPTILVRVPFSRTFTNTQLETLIGRLWAERGYTVVMQGTRGRYQSGGRYDPLRHERNDGIETLKWIARQPWFDGRLGMWGGSYFGYTQWVLWDQDEPAAFFIQMASSDFHGMFYPGGAFALESALQWAIFSHGETDVEPDPAALERGFAGFPLIEADDRAGADVAFFNDWVSHPERDSYWRAIDGDDRPRQLRAPVLMMVGWYDPFLPTQLNDFMRIKCDGRPRARAHTRLVIGPWAHARTITLPDGTTPRNCRMECLAPSVAWFDWHVAERDTGPEEPAVRIFVLGEQVWRDEHEWPLARTQYMPYFLSSGGRANSADGDGRLSPNPAADSQPPDHFIFDPRHPVPTAGGGIIGPRAGIFRQNDIEQRDDVLVYSTAPLDADLEVTGPVQVILHVATDAVHTDFTAKLVDVDAAGNAFNVCDGILRRGYVGKQSTEITIDLWPTSMLFRRGHRLRLEVSSSNHPRFDCNPNTGRPIATETHPVSAVQTVLHDRNSPSRLILPVIPR